MTTPIMVAIICSIIAIFFSALAIEAARKAAFHASLASKEAARAAALLSTFSDTSLSLDQIDPKVGHEVDDSNDWHDVGVSYPGRVRFKRRGTDSPDPDPKSSPKLRDS